MSRVLSRRAAISFVPVAGLAGCGFRPVYAPGPGGAASAVQADLAAISVGIIPDRSGQLLRQALQSRLERGGARVAHRYDLAVAFGLGGEGEQTQPDGSVTRIRIIGTASWTLLAQAPQRTTLTTGVARSLDGYDIINEQYFAADMNADDVTRRLAETIADQIILQLAGYFHRHPTAA